MKQLSTLFAALLFSAVLPAVALAADAKPAAPAAAPAAKMEPLDINSASKEDLMKLEGIGDARADAIIKARPYSGKDDLVLKKVLTKPVYDKIKAKIIAKQAPKK